MLQQGLQQLRAPSLPPLGCWSEQEEEEEDDEAGVEAAPAPAEGLC